MYVGFLNDTIFRKKTTIDTTATVYKQCVIDKKIQTYFNKETIITDPRPSRLHLGGKVVTGELSFHYDGKRHAPDNIPDVDLFRQLDEDQLKAFFIVVETVALANGSSQDELNTNLYTSGATKEYYVRDTLRLSRHIVPATVYDIDGLTPETLISLVTHFDFTLSFPEKDPVEFRIFLDRDDFLSSYPYSTITNVIVPCDPAYLLDPRRIDGTIDALVKSGTYSFKDLDPSIGVDDHTGLLTYTTRYISSLKSGSTSVHMLPFGILYQGAKPTSLQIREAIRNELFAEGLASENLWEACLPDIFITAQFYIIPAWDNQVRRPQGYVYPSIISAEKVNKLISTVLPDLDSVYIKQYQEILTLGYSEIFLSSIPDPLNSEEHFAILDCHPTYQYHMSQDGTAFLNQDNSTRDFNIKLNRALAVAFGAEVHPEVLTQTVDGLTWHTFSCARVEYHILSKASYNRAFGLED